MSTLLKDQSIELADALYSELVAVEGTLQSSKNRFSSNALKVLNVTKDAALEALATALSSTPRKQFWEVFDLSEYHAAVLLENKDLCEDYRKKLNGRIEDSLAETAITEGNLEQLREERVTGQKFAQEVRDYLLENNEKVQSAIEHVDNAKSLISRSLKTFMDTPMAQAMFPKGMKFGDLVQAHLKLSYSKSIAVTIGHRLGLVEEPPEEHPLHKEYMQYMTTEMNRSSVDVRQVLKDAFEPSAFIVHFEEGKQKLDEAGARLEKISYDISIGERNLEVEAAKRTSLNESLAALDAGVTKEFVMEALKQYRVLSHDNLASHIALTIGTDMKSSVGVHIDAENMSISALRNSPSIRPANLDKTIGRFKRIADCVPEETEIHSIDDSVVAAALKELGEIAKHAESSKEIQISLFAKFERGEISAEDAIKQISGAFAFTMNGIEIGEGAAISVETIAETLSLSDSDHISASIEALSNRAERMSVIERAVGGFSQALNDTPALKREKALYEQALGDHKTTERQRIAAKYREETPEDTVAGPRM